MDQNEQYERCTDRRIFTLETFFVDKRCEKNATKTCSNFEILIGFKT